MSLSLRQFKASDAEKIVSWCQDEDTFLKWGGDHFGKYPIAPQVLSDKYLNDNGDCPESDNFYPWTACEEGEPVGHFIMRYLNGDRKILRFGWVINDPQIRGKGYGKEMLTLGLEYAFRILKVDIVTLGVFENNQAAYHCYQAAGFRESQVREVAMSNQETWRILELEITRAQYE